MFRVVVCMQRTGGVRVSTHSCKHAKPAPTTRAVQINYVWKESKSKQSTHLRIGDRKWEPRTIHISQYERLMTLSTGHRQLLAAVRKSLSTVIPFWEVWEDVPRTMLSWSASRRWARQALLNWLNRSQADKHHVSCLSYTISCDSRVSPEGVAQCGSREKTHAA
jgi:hypothetical protein